VVDYQKLKVRVLDDGAIDEDDVDLICREFHSESKIEDHAVQSRTKKRARRQANQLPFKCVCQRPAGDCCIPRPESYNQRWKRSDD
jgi:hypothetical protein